MRFKLITHNGKFHYAWYDGKYWIADRTAYNTKAEAEKEISWQVKINNIERRNINRYNPKSISEV